MIKCSIITVCYNSEKYLEKTIKSVISQTYHNIEYIVVDGGSSDQTLEIIKKYAAIDKRIKWISEPDNGISDAMNKGIKLSSGEVIAHLHSDDYYPDESIIKSVCSEFETHLDAIWLTGGMYIINANGQIIEEIKVREYSFKRSLESNIILHPSTFVSRKAFNKIGLFDVSLNYAMDYDLWLRLGEVADPILLDMPLSCFRAHQGSRSTHEADNAFSEAWLIRKKHFGINIVKIIFHYYRYFKMKKINAKYNNSLLK